MPSGLRITKNDRRVLQRLIRETPDKVSDAVRGIATEMTNDIVLSYGESPSSPGEPPGVDTGTLRSGTTWELDSQDKTKAAITIQAEYGPYLEFGTSKMSARPFVTPVFERWRSGELKRFLRATGILT
ncbi:MAG: hypothetical protein L6Q98_08435 [Anaerolineae bacterium]|nr:hypothetical protein [Anaerolineae bacterium]NUQ02616.1 hypothetical protein [Anaerolineae bacterium]